MIIGERTDFDFLPKATGMETPVTVMWAPGLQIAEFCAVSLNPVSEGASRQGAGVGNVLSIKVNHKNNFQVPLKASI